MLPTAHKIAFLLFAALTCSIGVYGFYRVYLRIRAGRDDTEPHFDHLPKRLWHALATTLSQSRTFRKRPVVSAFHSFVFYGFVAYLLVNLVDAVEGYIPLRVASDHWPGALYNLTADLLSALVIIGVLALVLRRFFSPSRSDFAFNQRTLLHPDVNRGSIRRDSLVVSAFIVFHVGSRALGAGAKLAVAGQDRFQPFASLIARAIHPGAAHGLQIFGYWGALGSVLAFLMYFPFSKHIHIFMAPAKYLVARTASSGVLPPINIDLESEDLKAGANKLEDLVWPRLLDAYACIQCNRCQDACPATATGKSLSPSALEINKRMELNALARRQPGFEKGEASPHPLLAFALSPEAAWACTTCGACLEVCPVQDEPMLDIIDIRRHQVMMQGEFPHQLQAAFRKMERTKNPWGIGHEKRMEWAEGLNVKTIEEHPQPDVLYWVGCAASYDPQSQKTARALVQLLDHAGVDFAVLGKRECCTGDSARRAGNELLYQQLAGENISTLQQVKPKLIVASCPHCMNAIGKEYRQLGGHFEVVHHTEYLAELVTQGKLQTDAAPATLAFHDPCYLGRHNGIYDAPRNLLQVLSNDVRELDRNRESSFCCGAGGAQFWKEEEPGTERISDNRYREAQKKLAGAENKVLAVGCPFCKSMLESTPGKQEGDGVAVKDVAELLLEGVQRKLGIFAGPSGNHSSGTPAAAIQEAAAEPSAIETVAVADPQQAGPAEPPRERKKWVPRQPTPEPPAVVEASTLPPKRNSWVPRPPATPETRAEEERKPE